MTQSINYLDFARRVEAFSHLNECAPLLACATMLSWADMGVREEKGKNRGQVVDAIHELAGAARFTRGGSDSDADGEPWCARAVVAAWYVAGLATRQDISRDVSLSGSVFYMLHSTYNANRKLVVLAADVTDPMRQILPGDALCRYTMRPGFEHVPFEERKRSMTTGTHVEMVTRVYEDGFVDTVGGNTDSDDARDGDGVYLHRRRYSIHQDRVVGFVRPAWVAITPKA